MNALTFIRRGPRGMFSVPEGRRLARTLLGCAISYGAAKLIALPEGYWALITTLVVVTQPSLTQALGAARDQIVGACIGAVAGVIGLIAIEHGAAPLAVFAIELVPLAALAAARPALRLACITLVIVVLIPTGGGPLFQRPLHRVLEILIGAASAFIVAAILPNRSLTTAHRCVADTLRCLGQLVALHLSDDADDHEARAAQLEKKSAQAQQALDDALEEAEREHIIVPLQSRRADAIDKAAPFLRRLHSDTLFLAKAVSRDPQAARSDHLQESAAALQTLFDKLAQVLGNVHRDDAELDHVRATLESLKDACMRSEGSHDVAQFVIKLIVSDVDALISAIYPAAPSAPA
ncbi:MULTISPECIES: FUSC family protein [unclassified Caballeronia]|jgi:uncharacterized membrane protein YccC|uniref:FUSC family protein n=2 Tax=unclassified Caballeronia TaxID=2646786 RepID=UPI00202903D1|nr:MULTISPECIES: FUSC family protein [unclassified Caballeronia]MDR5774319.1 FUSC family protein [Caballeronia sp. LZ002]MDR5849754.1 FUSC family protein [Caballeronia sp. LZ003]